MKGCGRLSRRDLLTTVLLAAGSPSGAARPRRKVAAATTAYFHNSHADLILSRLFQGEDLDFKSRRPDLELVSLYVDQFPSNDRSRHLSREHGFRLAGSIAEALTLGGKELAVDGVLLIGEHGAYPKGVRGEELYPRKRFFDETAAVFRRTGRAVPVFTDKHLSHTWTEAKAVYETARELRFPLMAGSSLPLTWRRPPVEVKAGAPLREIVALSYHTLYGYGFHALEMVQCLAERRKEGESGIRRVQCLSGPAVWEAGRAGRFDLRLLDAALGRLTRPVPGASAGERLAALEKGVPEPVAFLFDYSDGLRAAVLTLNGIVGEWTAAWREEGREEPQATLFWTQDERPFGHFTPLLRAIEEMVHSGRAPYPVERTLLTSGLMHFLLESRHRMGVPLDTPELAIRYTPTGEWRDPGPPPSGRPQDQQ